MLILYIIIAAIILFLAFINLMMFFQYGLSIYTNISRSLWKEISFSYFLKSFLKECLYFNLRAALIITLLLPKKRPSSSGHTIIFIHGYLGQKSDGYYLKKRLRKAGFKSYYSFGHGSFDSVTELAEHIIDQIHEHQLESKPLILIGHSMGGLISAQIAETSQLHIQKVYTIGSPFLGTPVAKMGIGKACQDMVPGSSFTKRLVTLVQEAPPDKYFSAWSLLDNVVYPAPLHSPFNHRQFLLVKGLGHISLLFSKEIFNPLIKDLNDLVLDK